MNRSNEISKSSLLQEMVRVKKIRFKDEQKRRWHPKPHLDAVQRKANFEEFKTVYEETMQRLETSLGPPQVHQTRSGSLCRFPRAKKEVQHVETINIELPIHYGADRAVQIIENKIKPKRASRAAKVNREVITENLKSSLRPSKSPPSVAKSKKSVTIEEELGAIQEASRIEDSLNKGTNEEPDQNPPKVRKEKIHKTTSRHLNVVKPLKKKANTKIMDALSEINEKLQLMQEKYFQAPKVPYKNVNDCFTQIGNVEVLYENREYPQKIDVNDVIAKYDMKNISQNVLSDSKMQERIKEMNEMFPEFPKIEDTLKEIETHLDNIVNLKAIDSKKVQQGDGSDISCNARRNDHEVQQSMTSEILQICEEVKEQKRRTMRYQIEEVEDFCEKISEIANDECIDLEAACSEKNALNEAALTKLDGEDSKKPPTVDDFLEGPDLQSSIKKSNYLSRELRDMAQISANPMVKIFSENKLSFWREKVRQIRQESEGSKVESAARLFNHLKFSLEDSVYEPVA